MSDKSKRPSKSLRQRKRVRIPAEIETEVLRSCNYRCCVCYQLNNDLGEKQGQIAHLDNNPSNNKKDNLVFLCMPHHDRYDTTTRQSKGLTEGFIRAAYERLQEYFRLVNKDRVQITLVLDRNFDTFDDREQAQLIAELHRITNTTGGIRQINISRGSVKLQLEVTGDILTKLLMAQERGELRELNVTRIEYNQGEHGVIDFDWTFDLQLGVPSKREALQVVRDPDYVQPLVDDPQVTAKLMVKDSWPSEKFATLVLFTLDHVIGRAVLIPKSSLPTCPVERPRDLLKAFAERFGRPIPKYGGAKIIFEKVVSVRLPGLDPLMGLGSALGVRYPDVSLAFWTERELGYYKIAVFCRFGEEYVKELIAQGVQIDLDKWKKRPVKPGQFFR